MSAIDKMIEGDSISQLERVVYFSDNEPAAQELLDLRARLAKAEELLEKLEWVNVEDGIYCPMCNELHHTPDCELAAFLKGIK